MNEDLHYQIPARHTRGGVPRKGRGRGRGTRRKEGAERIQYKAVGYTGLGVN